MHRYWIFPLILMPLGLLLPLVTFLEGVVPSTVVVFSIYPMPVSTYLVLLRATVEPYAYFGAIGAAVSLALALGAAVWDQVRNGRIDRSGLSAARRLVSNLFWCGFYAFVLIAINDVIFSLLLRRLYSTPLGPNPYLRFFHLIPFVVVGLLNLIAVLWATIRAINTTNTLTPRVLVGKLRRSTQLQENHG